MGHKINPISLRLKITDTWKSRWFSKTNFAGMLKEDVQIREYLERHLKKAGLARIDIERLNDGSITVIIKTTKPGLIIGRGGAGIEELKKKIKQKLGIKKELKVNIEEVREVNLQAQVIANSITEQLEKRAAFRKLMKQNIEAVMNAGAKGVKIAIGGRLNGADIARSEHLSSGKIPLHTLRANIDFARSTAYTTYGTLGVKVWIYKGDIFAGDKKPVMFTGKQ
jgi:small subunit ribosomal protein S3